MIAGSVCDRLPRVPEGVQCLGFVKELDTIYSEAGVVISPLTVGSGLKIKLVEAMGQGKAIVATSVTADGVEEKVRSAVVLTDDPEDFSDALCRLLQNHKLREEQGRKALDAAGRWFSEEACHADFLELIDGATAYSSTSIRKPETAIRPAGAPATNAN